VGDLQEKVQELADAKGKSNAELAHQAKDTETHGEQKVPETFGWKPTDLDSLDVGVFSWEPLTKSAKKRSTGSSSRLAKPTPQRRVPSLDAKRDERVTKNVASVPAQHRVANAQVKESQKKKVEEAELQRPKPKLYPQSKSFAYEKEKSPRSGKKAAMKRASVGDRPGTSSSVTFQPKKTKKVHEENAASTAERGSFVEETASKSKKSAHVEEVQSSKVSEKRTNKSGVGDEPAHKSLRKEGSTEESFEEYWESFSPRSTKEKQKAPTTSKEPVNENVPMKRKENAEESSPPLPKKTKKRSLSVTEELPSESLDGEKKRKKTKAGEQSGAGHGDSSHVQEQNKKRSPAASEEPSDEGVRGGKMKGKKAREGDDSVAGPSTAQAVKDVSHAPSTSGLRQEKGKKKPRTEVEPVPDSRASGVRSSAQVSQKSLSCLALEGSVHTAHTSSQASQKSLPGKKKTSGHEIAVEPMQEAGQSNASRRVEGSKKSQSKQDLTTPALVPPVRPIPSRIDRAFEESNEAYKVLY
jgi:hypothetical protein